MDIFGKERRRLQETIIATQSQLNINHARLSEAHAIIVSMNARLVSAIDSSVQESKSHTASAAMLFSQNRTMRKAHKEE